MGEWWLFYKHIFVEEMLDHLPIVGSLLFLLVILAGGLRTIGLPHLFWHRRKWDRAIAGMASGVFVTFAFYVAYLLDAADCVAERAPSSAFDGLQEWRGGWYFFGCLSCLAATAGVAVAIPLAARLARLVPRSEREHVAKQPSPVGRVGRSPFIVAFVSGLALATAIWWSTEEGALGRLLARADFIDLVVWGEPEFMNGHRLAAILAGILSLSLVVGAFGGRRRLPASVSICVLLAWVIAADGFLAFTFHEAPVVSLAVIACFMLLAGRARYKIRLEALARHYDDPVSLEKGWRPSRPAEQRLRHLRSRLPSGQTIPSTFAEMRSAEAEGRFPTLVYTPMLVEDGRRLFTDDEVRAIEENARSEVARIAPMMANFVTPAATPIARPSWFLRAS